MADLDDLREGADFGLGINCENQSFHVKGAENLPWGMKDRLSRIFNPKTGKAVMLAFDHGFIMGPTSGLERIDLNIVPLIEYADCLMCTVVSCNLRSLRIRRNRFVFVRTLERLFLRI